MATKSLVVRNVDERIFQEFKAEAGREGLILGKAITMAMMMWLGKGRKRPRLSILDLKPVRFRGKFTSADIDKELYR